MPPQPHSQNQTQQAPAAPARKSIRKNKKVLLLAGGIFCIILLLIAILTAVLQEDKPVELETVELTFWARSLTEEQMTPLIEAFEAENPYIKVTYEEQSPSNYKERMLTRLERGDASVLPDILELDEVWIPEIYPYLNIIQENNDIPSRYATIPLENNKVIVATQSNINQYLYGVPFRFDALALAYNDSHLAAKGFDATDFNKLDWSSLLIRSKDLVQTRTEQSGRFGQHDMLERGGLAIGSPENVTNAPEIVQLLLVQNNAEIYDRVEQRYVLGEKFEEVMEFYNNFAIEEVWNTSFENDLEAFADGDVSMVLVRSQDIDRINELNEGLQFTTVLPAKIGGIRNLSLSRSLVIPAVNPYYSQTIKFLEFMTRPEHGISLFESSRETSETFIPAQVDSLNQLPSDSPFAVYSDINPSAEVFKTYDYVETTKMMNKYLVDTYRNVYDRLEQGQPIRDFPVNAEILERELNTIIPTPTPSPNAQ